MTYLDNYKAYTISRLPKDCFQYCNVMFLPMKHKIILNNAFINDDQFGKFKVDTTDEIMC